MNSKRICSVCGMSASGHSIRHCSVLQGDNDPRLDRWRDDRGLDRPYQKTGIYQIEQILSDPFDYPTISTVITCAEDITNLTVRSTYGIYVLVIAHVEHYRAGANGKAFMPKLYRTSNSYSNPGRWKCNFDIYQTYEDALVLGEKAMQKLVDDEEADYAAFEAHQEELKRRFSNQEQSK